MMDTSALISIHLGQAGVQMGYSCWELFCQEHSVLANGTNAPSKTNVCNSAIFSPCPKEITHSPRAVFADLDPSFIDKVRTAPYGNVFKPNCLIKGKEDAANNFATGYFTVGNELSEKVLEAIRQQAEDADTIQGFLVFRSLGGGTGSGFSSNLMAKMQNEFGKMPISEFSIYPSPKLSPVIVEPYNAVLALHGCMEVTRCCFMLDNTVLNEMYLNLIGIRYSNFNDINNLIAQIVSGVTGNMRLPGEENSMEAILSDLVPLPRIHFPLISYAPIYKVTRNTKEEVAESDLVSSCLQPENQTLDCNMIEGKLAACSMLLRGNVNKEQENEALQKHIESGSFDFTSFSSNKVKTLYSKLKPKIVPCSKMQLGENAAVLLSNTSSVQTAWMKLNKRFCLMFKNRTYLHHYLGQGMEESEFHEAMIDIRALESDYETVFN